MEFEWDKNKNTYVGSPLSNKLMLKLVRNFYDTVKDFPKKVAL